jgi:OHCU decarboxylase
MTVNDLNGLPASDAEQELLKCCGSHRWARAMAVRRPFASVEQLQQAAEEEWWKLESRDWIEAFSHHPRIGERVKAQGWAKQEQSGVRGASEQTLQELEHLNRTYEEKFGHVFLIFASGKSAEEMLAALRTRLRNRENVELQNAAAEQAKITRLRLAKLTSADPSLGSG